MADSLQVEDIGAVRILTLNRPETFNAIDRDTAFALSAALDELDLRDDLRVGVVHGSGGNFCSGMDLKAFTTEGIPLVPGRGFAGMTQRASVKPLIAAIEGYALAGGFEIALSCDIIVAAEGAQFGLPEVKRGLVAAAGGLIRLPRRIPYHVAMSLILTGDFLDARTAHNCGLVGELCANGQARDSAVALAERIAANAPMAVQVSKAVVSQSADWAANVVFERQAALTDPIFRSEDAQEGSSAFAERRTPNWTGH